MRTVEEINKEKQSKHHQLRHIAGGRVPVQPREEGRVKKKEKRKHSYTCRSWQKGENKGGLNRARCRDSASGFVRDCSVIPLNFNP